MMLDKTVNIIIGCDSDQDRVQFGGTRFDDKSLNWNGIEQGLEKFDAIINRTKDMTGNCAKVTWYIRSDQQIKEMYGSFSWLAEYFRDIWKDFKLRGDELGWHPHLTRWCENKNCWYQEIEDKKWIENCLREGYSSLLKELGTEIKSAKAGFYFHDNFTMQLFNELGIRIDLSATPGFKSTGSVDDRGSFFINAYDWKITPESPYFPSKEDYRRPAKTNENSLKILECPNTIYYRPLKNVLLSLIPIRPRSEKKLTLPRLYRDKSLLLLTMNPIYFAEVLKKKFKEAKSKGTASLITYFHPDELLPTSGSFSITNLEDNLENIPKYSKKNNSSFEFLTAKEFLIKYFKDAP